MIVMLYTGKLNDNASCYFLLGSLVLYLLVSLLW